MEHLLPRSASSASQGESEVELLAELLKRAPGVVLLATSRERLALQEEWVYEVEGLTYPTSLHILPVRGGVENLQCDHFVPAARRPGAETLFAFGRSAPRGAYLPVGRGDAAGRRAGGRLGVCTLLRGHRPRTRK